MSTDEVIAPEVLAEFQEPAAEPVETKEPEEDKFDIVQELPPIWEEAHKHFKIDDARTVYTYGEKLYNPSGLTIDDALYVHEFAHSLQQKAFEGGPAAWWKKYFEDAAFRVEQEIAAYNRQYAFYCTQQRDRNARARFLWQIATDMAGPTYGGVIGHSEAMQKIRGNTR